MTESPQDTARFIPAEQVRGFFAFCNAQAATMNMDEQDRKMDRLVREIGAALDSDPMDPLAWTVIDVCGLNDLTDPAVASAYTAWVAERILEA